MRQVSAQGQFIILDQVPAHIHRCAVEHAGVAERRLIVRCDRSTRVGTTDDTAGQTKRKRSGHWDLTLAHQLPIEVELTDAWSALALGEFSLLRGGLSAMTGSGKIFLKGKTTLMDFIALAHGYTVKGDIRRLKLIRKGKTYVINVYDIIEQGNKDLNVIIDAGDTVDIPELPEVGEKVFVMGEVEDQGVYDLKDAEDLLSAIALAGKFTDEAKEENTLIVRATEPGKKPLVMMADCEALLERADLSQNIKLRDGDLVYIPRMVIGDINKWIRNLDPLLDWVFWSKYNDIVDKRPF